jgi:hypothetical protein
MSINLLVMSSIDYLRIFSDSDGCSHFDTSNIELKMNDYAPPATPLKTSPAESAKAMVFFGIAGRMVRGLASDAGEAVVVFADRRM